MPTLLYQCPAGLSGDMNLGAMIALGVAPVDLAEEPDHQLIVRRVTARCQLIDHRDGLLHCGRRGRQLVCFFRETYVL